MGNIKEKVYSKSKKLEFDFPDINDSRLLGATFSIAVMYTVCHDFEQILITKIVVLVFGHLCLKLYIFSIIGLSLPYLLTESIIICVYTLTTQFVDDT